MIADEVNGLSGRETWDDAAAGMDRNAASDRRHS
jgi:hypothetical protein